MAGKILQAAVVGAGTLLGKELLDEISNSAAAVWDLRLFGDGEETEGQLTSVGDEALVMHAVSNGSFAGLDLVMFAGDREEARRFGPLAVKAGAAVVDLTGALQGSEGFLLRSPWVQASPRPDLTTAGIAVPHPAAQMLALVGERLSRQFVRAELTATVLEPASAAGASGVDELHQQTVGLLAFHELPKAVFDAQLAFNLQGRLGPEATVNPAAVAQRIRAEIGTLLGSGAPAQCRLTVLEAPVFHSYVISVYVQLGAPGNAVEVRKAMQGDPVEADEEPAPSNRAATETGKLLVSVEADGDDAQAFWLLLAGDDLRVLAQSAVLAAQELAALRPAARVQ